MLAYAGGDASSFEALFQRHRRPLFTFLLHNLGDRAAAEDLFQEIFLRLVRGRVGYRPTGSFRSWLFRIAHNALTDHRRRTGLRESHSGETTMTTANDEQVDRSASLPSEELSADPVSSSQDRELRDRIEAALLRIPTEQREVFLLRERGGARVPAHRRTHRPLTRDGQEPHALRPGQSSPATFRKLSFTIGVSP